MFSDEANICKIENIKKDKVAHPYNCSKYIDCSGAGNTFLTEGDVWHHEKGNVYDPQTGASATSGTVGCATQTSKLKCLCHSKNINLDDTIIVGGFAF